MTPKEYGKKIIELERDKDYKGAYEIVRESLTIYPTNLFLLRNEVYLLYRLKRIKEARERAEERMGLLKDDPFFLRTYLLILEKEKAKEDIEHMIEGDIFLMRINDKEFYIFLSKLVARVFNKEKGLEILKRAVSIFPDNNELKGILDGWEKEGGSDGRYRYYKEQFKGKKVKDAIMEIENLKVLPNYANDYELHLYLAELYKKIKRYDKTIEVYKYLLTLKDDEFTRKMLGYAYYKIGDIEDALVYLKDIFLKDPYDHYLYSTILKIFEARFDLEGLERLILEAISITPDARHLYGVLKRAKKWERG
ncbi:MAG: hypothetical protein HY999_05515 [Nitrospinae bacterium]|nr:hypothetical protein [Nitrospinota bacterium]